MSSEVKLTGTKIGYYKDRVEKWARGERIAPITVDMSLTRVCNYRCEYCYGKLQENESNGHLDWETLQRFIDDCKEIGVKGISLVSDGESTCSPYYTDFITYAHTRGLDIALGSHGANFTRVDLLCIVPRLTYLRFNISSGLPYSYSKIHGVPVKYFYKVCGNILQAVEVKKMSRSKCTIGMQMVMRPGDIDNVLPLAQLAIELGVDYLVVKHCSDDENGSLGVDYSKYDKCTEILQRAERMSTENTAIVVKWDKIKEGNKRSYSQCYGPPFIIQLSGSGLVAPCGMLFNDKYKKYHIGNIKETRFKEIVRGDRYWEVMSLLASKEFDARSMCGCLCLQHETNKWLDEYSVGVRCEVDTKSIPQHLSFI